MDVITVGNDILKEKAALVADFDDDLRLLVKEMENALDKKKGVGLAAPQVSVKKRLFITKIPNDEFRVFINPEIIQTSQDVERAEEGCLSIPGVWGNVVRPVSVTIQAHNLDGKIFKINAGGVLARVIQHEFDHLNGVLFIDKLDEKQRERVMKIYAKKNKKV